ncbi:MAG: signal peptidase I [Oscillospiraceae bacterium]|nr:signal peptidase I [Oscillospiraceae bacterium]
MRKTGRPAIKKKDLLISALLILATALFLWNFRFVRVDGESMAPTLSDGQILLASTHVSELQKDDIVVFEQEGQRCVKRIVAVSGDRVLLKDGVIYVNETFLPHYEYLGEETAYTLQEGEFFVLGDNTRNSTDSRIFGPIKLEQIQFKFLLALF